jgi:hypothetical protein
MDTRTPLYAVGKIMETHSTEINKQDYTVLMSTTYACSLVII